MKSENIEKLKAAVAQFNEAFEIINRCLPEAIEEAATQRRDMKAAAARARIIDGRPSDRLSYEEAIAYEDQLAFENAWYGWQHISKKIDTFFPSIFNDIDNAACEALSYDDFVANSATEAEIDRINLQRRRDNIRPMTQEEMDRLVREDLHAYAQIILGLPQKHFFRVEEAIVEYQFDLHGNTIVVSLHPNGEWKWHGLNSLLGGSIWHLEAAAKMIPTFEALTNVRLHFGTESMSARAGDLPCIQGLEAKWAQEAYDLAAGLRHDNEAIWEQRLAEAAEAGKRVRIEGNPDDVLPVFSKDHGPICAMKMLSGFFGAYLDRRAL